MTGREILQDMSDTQSTWTWWIITRPPNLNDWKRNLIREAHPTIDLILIRNQSTYIEKEKQKNNNKIRQHEKTNPSLNSPSPFPLSNPFFCSNSCHYDCHHHPTRRSPVTDAACPLPLPPQTARSKGSGSDNSSGSLVMAVCKSFPQAYADWKLHCQIITWLISLISPPPFPPPPQQRNNQ